MKRSVMLLSNMVAPPSRTAEPLQARKPLALGCARSMTLATALIALSGCASKPEIAVNSYCDIKATELIDLRDPGLQRLTPVNQGAVLTGDDNHARFCRGAVNKGR